MENKEAYKTHFKNLEEMGKSVGKELGISNWVEINQEKINLFAKITEDEQWIHIDAEKSAKESPYKTTIAHGFMILSLASRFSYDTVTIGSVKMGDVTGLSLPHPAIPPSAIPSTAPGRGGDGFHKGCERLHGGPLPREILQDLYHQCP